MAMYMYQFMMLWYTKLYVDLVLFVFSHLLSSYGMKASKSIYSIIMNIQERKSLGDRKHFIAISHIFFLFITVFKYFL